MTSMDSKHASRVQVSLTLPHCICTKQSCWPYVLVQEEGDKETCWWWKSWCCEVPSLITSVETLYKSLLMMPSLSEPQGYSSMNHGMFPCKVPKRVLELASILKASDIVGISENAYSHAKRERHDTDILTNRGGK